MMEEDSSLLARFCVDGSQDAFTEIVKRHLDFVYSIGLRSVSGDGHLAKDVCQEVFTSLAKKAPSLRDRRSLSGWLYRATKYAASDIVRKERSRRNLEREATEMNELSRANLSEDEWERARPLLDDAIGSLSEKDQDAICMRFFEGLKFGKIGEILKIEENAARMRVSRALDRLHAAFGKRGMKSSTAALATALGGHISNAAPSGLLQSVASGAIASAGMGLSGTIATSVFAMLKSAKLAFGAVAAVAALSTALLVKEKIDAKSEKEALLASEEKAIQMNNQLVALRSELETLRSEQAQTNLELEKLRRVARNTVNRNLLEQETGERLTKAVVDARYKRAQELQQQGAYAEALAEYLWCFDVGMVEIPILSALRSTTLLSKIHSIGEFDNRAYDELKKRRDAAEEMILSGESDDGKFPYSIVKTINRKFEEPERSLHLYDQLPTGDSDRRRRSLGIYLFDELLEAQRYDDIVVSTSYASMRHRFEHTIARRITSSQGTESVEERNGSLKASAIRHAATHIEALVGSGQLEKAVELADRVLEYDSSIETVETLDKRLERVGRTDLLDALLKR